MKHFTWMKYSSINDLYDSLVFWATALINAKAGDRTPHELEARFHVWPQKLFSIHLTEWKSRAFLLLKFNLSMHPDIHCWACWLFCCHQIFITMFSNDLHTSVRHMCFSPKTWACDPRTRSKRNIVIREIHQFLGKKRHFHIWERYLMMTF